MINLTAQEAKGAKCPMCGDSLAALKAASDSGKAGYRVSGSGGPGYARPPVTTATSNPTPRVTTSARRPPSTATRTRGGSTWWIWVLVLLAVKGGIFALRGINNTHNSSTAPTFNSPTFLDNERYEFPTEPGAFPRESGDYSIPTDAQLLPERYQPLQNPWDADRSPSPPYGGRSPFSDSPPDVPSPSGPVPPTPGVRY
jgi:hypothetical protein